MNRLLAKMLALTVTASVLGTGCALPTELDADDGATQAETVGTARQALEDPSAAMTLSTQLTLTNASATPFTFTLCSPALEVNKPPPPCDAGTLVSGESASRTGRPTPPPSAPSFASPDAVASGDVHGHFTVGAYVIPFSAKNPTIGAPYIEIQGAGPEGGLRLFENETQYLQAIAPRTAEDFRTKSYVGYQVRMERGVDANGAKQMGITILTEGKRACEPFRTCTLP